MHSYIDSSVSYTPINKNVLNEYIIAETVKIYYKTMFL